MHIFRIIEVSKRFDFNFVKKLDCFSLIALRSFTLESHVSSKSKRYIAENFRNFVCEVKARGPKAYLAVN